MNEGDLVALIEASSATFNVAAPGSVPIFLLCMSFALGCATTEYFVKIAFRNTPRETFLGATTLLSLLEQYPEARILYCYLHADRTHMASWGARIRLVGGSSVAMLAAAVCYALRLTVGLLWQHSLDVSLILKVMLVLAICGGVLLRIALVRFVTVARGLDIEAAIRYYVREPGAARETTRSFALEPLQSSEQGVIGR